MTEEGGVSDFLTQLQILLPIHGLELQVSKVVIFLAWHLTLLPPYVCLRDNPGVGMSIKKYKFEHIVTSSFLLFCWW